MSENSTPFPSPVSPAPGTPGRGWSPRRVRLAGTLVGILLAAALTALVSWLALGIKTNPQPASTDVNEYVSVNMSKDYQRPVVSADGLVETCLERQAPDNLTFVILRLVAE